MGKWLLQSHAPKEGSKTGPRPGLVRCLEHGIKRRGHRSLLCGWWNNVNTASAAHAHAMSFLIIPSPAREKGWEEALEGSLFCLLSVMDIHFMSFCLFPQTCTPNLCSSETRWEPGRASLRHGNPEWSSSPACSWMFSDNNVLIKDLSLKYYH